MDTWHSPPSIGIDKRKEYVIAKLKEGFELRVSPNRVRLFKAGLGYIPCALPIYRRLLADNMIVAAGTRAGDQIFIFNPEIKIKGTSSRKAKPVVVIDDDPLEEELTIEVPISLAELDAVDIEGADDLLDVDDEEEEEDLTDSFLDEDEEEEEKTDESILDEDEEDEEEEGYEDDEVEV